MEAQVILRRSQLQLNLEDKKEDFDFDKLAVWLFATLKVGIGIRHEEALQIDLPGRTIHRLVHLQPIFEWYKRQKL